MSAQDFGRLYSKIENYGIAPKIKADGAISVAAAKALCSGGLDIAEITFEPGKTREAAKATKEISSELPGMLLLAGNVSSANQAKAAAESGALVIAGAGLNKEVAEFCANIKMPFVVGCGFEEIENILAQCPEARLIAAADEKDIPGYLSHGRLIACSVDIATGAPHESVKESAARMVKRMLGFDLAHVVINCENSEQAERDSGKVESIFGLEKKDLGASFSNADILHFTKQRSYGKNGQIAICSDFIERAVFYLKRAGRQFIEESARYDEENRLASIYLDSIIGGFAIKLVRR